MKVVSIKNVSNKRISLITNNRTEISLPPNGEFSDIDVTNLGDLGEKISYVANLTEVGQSSGKQKLYD